MYAKGQRVRVRADLTVSAEHGGKAGTVVRSARAQTGGSGARVYLVALPDGPKWLNDYELEVV